MAERRLLGAELADAMFDWVSEERAAEAQAFEDMCHEAEAQAE